MTKYRVYSNACGLDWLMMANIVSKFFSLIYNFLNFLPSVKQNVKLLWATTVGISGDGSSK